MSSDRPPDVDLAAVSNEEWLALIREAPCEDTALDIVYQSIDDASQERVDELLQTLEPKALLRVPEEAYDDDKEQGDTGVATILGVLSISRTATKHLTGCSLSRVPLAIASCACSFVSSAGRDAYQARAVALIKRLVKDDPRRVQGLLGGLVPEELIR